MRILPLVVLLSLTASCATVDLQFDRSSGPFTQLVGKWAPLVEGKVDCADSQTISFSKDLSVAAFQFSKPFKDDNGKEVRAVTYKILSVSDNTITMFLNGEKRRTNGGDPIVWTLVLIRENAYVWRQTDWGPGDSTVPFLRCDA